MAARGFARMLAGHLEADISVRFIISGYGYLSLYTFVVPLPKVVERKKEKKELVISTAIFFLFPKAHHIP
jgi:hypothetical protein